MDNFERGDRARRALDAGGYERLEDTINITIPTPDGKEVEGPGGYPISDLIADLCHLAQRHGLDVGSLLSEGIEHYGADCIEVAWEHSSEWNSLLQSEDNIDRARSVLRTAGVPEVFDHAIFVKVGFIPPNDKPNDKED